MDEYLRSCCPIGPEHEMYFDSFDEFLKYVPQFNNLGFKYKVVIRKSRHFSGEYYNHIYRPIFSYKLQKVHPVIKRKPFKQEFEDLPIIDREEYIRYVRQLEIIMSDLADVFKVVEPSNDNFKVFGNALRNIIILSCTEIDAMMKNIMKSNGCSKERFSMNDYIILKDILKLKEYELSIDFFESLGAFSPFKRWNKNKPTASLSWYDAYNKIKHDRDQNFPLANLRNAINSIIAFAILLLAQYGWNNSIWERKFSNVFKIKKYAKWEIEDFYIPFIYDSSQTPIQHPKISKHS